LLVSNGNTLTWNSLIHSGRTALLDLGKQVGYRLVLSDLAISQELLPGDTFSIASRWLNRGNPPVYERWRLTLELRDDRGQVRWATHCANDAPTQRGAAPIAVLGCLPRPFIDRFQLVGVIFFCPPILG
jgi:hypothetical protein